jgi:DNA-binding IclR family transcriptional regulator
VAERGLAAFTPQTITDLGRLEAELERIRALGYAVDNEEYDEGLRCIGAAVRDHSGHVVAALGIGGPVTRITPDRVGALGLSRRLGAHRSGAYAPAALRVRTTSSQDPVLRPTGA